jgi:protein arginine kinase activator
VKGSEEREFHVCPACAQELGATPPQVGDDPVNVLLAGLEEVAGGGVCPGCGWTWERFRSGGRLGCARCYETFREELRPLLRRIHGAVRHAGRAPRSPGADQGAARLRRLHEELERAVGAEDYERAAELRDRLAELEPAADTGTGEGE